MNSIDDDPMDESDRNLFTLANLALWAGDADGAEHRFRELIEQRTRFGYKSGGTDTLLKSARTAYRQLRRRLGEFERLNRGASAAGQVLQSPRILTSAGQRLTAVITAVSERDYVMRCYLNDLSAERYFYERSAGLTDRVSNKTIPDARQRVAELPYGLDLDTKAINSGNMKQLSSGETVDEATRDTALEIAWVRSSPSMFLRVEVSDFATVSVEGIWTRTALPESTAEVIDSFQVILDTIDPK